MSVLDEILDGVRADLAERQQHVSLEELKDKARQAPSPLDAMPAFKADGITVQQFNESAGGQVVFHLHMHVMPRHNGVALLPPASRKEDGKVLEANAAKLIEALKG